jgi:hypothetical protein
MAPTRPAVGGLAALMGPVADMPTCRQRAPSLSRGARAAVAHALPLSKARGLTVSGFSVFFTIPTPNYNAINA